MAQQSFAGLAVLVALAFAIMALHGCASSKQRAAQADASAVVPLNPAASAPEFHGAPLGGDALRSRLPSES